MCLRIHGFGKDDCRSLVPTGWAGGFVDVDDVIAAEAARRFLEFSSAKRGGVSTAGTGGDCEPGAWRRTGSGAGRRRYRRCSDTGAASQRSRTTAGAPSSRNWRRRSRAAKEPKVCGRCWPMRRISQAATSADCALPHGACLAQVSMPLTPDAVAEAIVRWPTERGVFFDVPLPGMAYLQARIYLTQPYIF